MGAWFWAKYIRGGSTPGASRKGNEVAEPLRLGFIGGGLNSAVGRCHEIASRMDDRWHLVSGAFSRHIDVNQATGEAWRVEPQRVYESWSQFIDSEAGRLDAVALLTPTPQHTEQIEELLTAGFNVISEKAITGNSQEARSLASLAKKEHKFLRVTMNYSGYPMVRELRYMIRRGDLGEIVGINVRMPQEGFLRQDANGQQVMPQDWRQRDGDLPTVSLDLGTHSHHLISFLLDADPVKVVGTHAHHGKVTDVADYVSSLAKLPSGADVNMWFGKCVLGERNGLAVDVYGDKASAHWKQAFPEELRIADVRGSIAIIDRASPGIVEASQSRYQRFKAGHPAGFLEAFANLYWDLADDMIATREGKKQSGWTFGAAHASNGLSMLEAIAMSTASEKWEDVSLIVGESSE